MLQYAVHLGSAAVKHSNCPKCITPAVEHTEDNSMRAGGDLPVHFAAEEIIQ